MKIIAVLMLTLMGSELVRATTIVADGKSDYVIVLAEKPLPANERAATELQKHLAEMSGATLKIQNDTAPLPEHAILIGPGKYVDQLSVKLDAEKLGNDGFVLKTVGDRIVIAGPGPRGSMYGTYDVLEKLGVRWFTAKVTRIPKTPTIDLPALDETQVPAFEYREPNFMEAMDKDWAARNRAIGAGLHLDQSTGGNISYADFVHSFDRLIPPALFAEHPEYFPMVGGKRINGYVQRCLSNPAVIDLAVTGVKKAFADHPDTVITTVSQNDVDKWCECDECKKLAAQYGGQSGVYIWFVNQVAERIEKDYPDKLIDTLAYQFTEAAPKGIAPRKNVRVRLCPINVCEAHPYEHDDHPGSKAFMVNLSAWGKITDTLYIWHYNTNFANYLMPMPDFAEFPADLKLYHRSGVRGVFFEGAYNTLGASDAELRSYLMAKLLWNPDDSRDLVGEWMTGVYGKAAEPMRAWFDLLQKTVENSKEHFAIYSPPTVYYLADPILAQGDAFFDAAEKLAAGDPVATEYVAKNRLGLRYVKLVRTPTGGEAFTSFVADCRKFKIANISEGQTVDAWEKAYLTQPGLKK